VEWESGIVGFAGEFSMGWRRFYDRVTEGMELAELWSQFKSEARTTYRLYSHEIDWETMRGAPRWRRFFRISWAFFISMLMHLSPARRVLLLISLLLVLLGTRGGQGTQPAISLYGGLGLLLLLALELADRVIMKRDLEIAREIQQWLIPEEPPSLEGADIAFATRPANTVGGDYYDVILRRAREKANQAVLLVMADVAGKSIPAALLMATFQSSLKAMLTAEPTLQELAHGLNYYTCTRSQEGRRFTTAFLAEFELNTGVVTYINAGHNHPVLLRAGGQVERCERGGLPFGIRPEAQYELGTTTLGAGDLLLVFTDGVTEAVNESDEEYGEPRLLAHLQQITRESADAAIRELMTDLGQFVGQARQHDDMTWLIVSVPAGVPTAIAE
jgi:sigma-B regulation protein RsbU (phosphoserine phosphatase)